MREFSEDLSDQIIYRGEGNSSIVIALRNKSKVIRLLKVDGKIMRSSQDHCVTQQSKRSIRFIHSIMKPLTLPYLSDNTELVHLKSDFINLLSKKIQAERPVHRLGKNLYYGDQYALVMDDLCGLPSKLTRRLHSVEFVGPTISVEIKPKQGFLLPQHRLAMMQSCHSNDDTVSKIKASCLYGLNQSLKLARGRIDRLSEYCPLNLFSGCPVRMRLALQALLDNPQNNLRVFKNLALAYDETDFRAMLRLFEDTSSKCGNSSNCEVNESTDSIDTNKERLIDILIQCLLSEPMKTDHQVEQTEEEQNETCRNNDENLFSTKSFGDQCLRHPLTQAYQSSRDRKLAQSGVISHQRNKLPESCVLACILRAQRLDTVGPFEAKHMLEWLLEDSNRNSIGNSLCERQVLDELSEPRLPACFGARSQLPFESKRDYYLRKVWEFLVSLTAKDCSIIITVRQITQASHEMLRNRQLGNNLLIDKIRGAHYVFHVGIADFDQKMPLKILRICENLNQIMFLMKNQENISRMFPSRDLSAKGHPERDRDHLAIEKESNM